MTAATSRSRRWPRLFLLAPLLSLLDGCAIGTPFRAGALRAAGRPEDEVLVSFTHARLKDGDRSTFFRYTQLVFDGMQGSPGLLASSIRRRLLGSEVWTFSVWERQEDLERFARSPHHRELLV